MAKHKAQHGSLRIDETSSSLSQQSSKDKALTKAQTVSTGESDTPAPGTLLPTKEKLSAQLKGPKTSSKPILGASRTPTPGKSLISRAGVDDTESSDLEEIDDVRGHTPNPEEYPEFLNPYDDSLDFEEEEDQPPGAVPGTSKNPPPQKTNPSPTPPPTIVFKSLKGDYPKSSSASDATGEGEAQKLGLFPRPPKDRYDAQAEGTVLSSNRERCIAHSTNAHRDRERPGELPADNTVPPGRLLLSGVTRRKHRPLTRRPPELPPRRLRTPTLMGRRTR